jgi:hypothetical protein
MRRTTFQPVILGIRIMPCLIKSTADLADSLKSRSFGALTPRARSR